MPPSHFPLPDIPDVTYVVTAACENADGKSELLAEVFAACGVGLENIEEQVRGGRLCLSVYFLKEAAARTVKAKLDAAGLQGVDIALQPLATPDWRDAWKTGIVPFPLTSTIDVVPVWNREGYDAGGRRVILLDTTLAFGTGLHETTRFTAGLIEGLSGTFTDFLDIGTGTGLLALVARFNGAAEIWAMDYDPQSIRVAAQNFAVNEVGDIHLEQADITVWSPGRVFDVVAANLVSDDLIAWRDRIVCCVRPGGRLVISGISRSRFAEVARHYRSAGLQEEKSEHGREWSAVLYRRPEGAAS